LAGTASCDCWSAHRVFAFTDSARFAVLVLYGLLAAGLGLRMPILLGVPVLLACAVLAVAGRRRDR
jgi:hypothetical protein